MRFRRPHGQISRGTEASWEAAEACTTRSPATVSASRVANTAYRAQMAARRELLRMAPLSNNLVLAQIAQHSLNMPKVLREAGFRMTAAQHRLNGKFHATDAVAESSARMALSTTLTLVLPLQQCWTRRSVTIALSGDPRHTSRSLMAGRIEDPRRRPTVFALDSMVGRAPYRRCGTLARVLRCRTVVHGHRRAMCSTMTTSVCCRSAIPARRCCRPF